MFVLTDVSGSKYFFKNISLKSGVGGNYTKYHIYLKYADTLTPKHIPVLSFQQVNFTYTCWCL